MLSLILSAIVVLISFDGLKPSQVTPEIAPLFYALKQNGVDAAYMEPSFPASTFINHASLITGCTTEEHGIVSNAFIDSKEGEFRMSNDAKWQECEPLWAAASRQKIKNASYVWPMTSGDWHGIKPTYAVETPTERKKADRFFRHFDNKKEWGQILDWLKLPEEKRPQLILGYFPDVDGAGHRFGPEAPQTLNVVKKYDRQFAQFLKAAQKLPYYNEIDFVIVSDHGMALGTKPVDTDIIFDPLKVTTTTSSGTYINFYTKDAQELNATKNFLKKFPQWHVYSADAFPKHWHYNNPRSGNLVLTVDPPYYLVSQKKLPKKKTFGYHGYDPQFPEMRAFFAAWGPHFKKTNLKNIKNIDVAPTIAKILKISFQDKRSGKPINSILSN